MLAPRPWQEAIDLRRGRMPLIRASGADVTYELAILGGVMADELFVPHPLVRLVLRCDDADNIFASHTHARRFH